ncbi:MAG: sulfurtransferase complex subunit TusD [Halioglobus sp.]
MIYSLLVLSSPTAGLTARTAAGFAQAVLARGHSIRRVFFLGEGVLHGATARVFPQDEANPLHDWLELSREHGTELLLCVSSALRHGMLDASEAARYEHNLSTVHPAFSIAGLGQLIDANAASDRLITFAG